MEQLPGRCRRLNRRELQVSFGGVGERFAFDGHTKSEPNKWSGDGNTVCYSAGARLTSPFLPWSSWAGIKQTRHPVQSVISPGIMKEWTGRPGRVTPVSQVENLISCRFLCSQAVPHSRSTGARASMDNSVHPTPSLSSADKDVWWWIFKWLGEEGELKFGEGSLKRGERWQANFRET